MYGVSIVWAYKQLLSSQTFNLYLLYEKSEIINKLSNYYENITTVKNKTFSIAVKIIKRFPKFIERRIRSNF